MQSATIPIKSLFLDDERFRISYFFSLDKLIQSLKHIGLVQPPIVAHRGGHTILVSGWKRVMACREISLSPLPVFVLEEEDDLKAFEVPLFENLAAREMSLLEKAEIVLRLKKFGEGEETIVKRYFPLLAIPPTLQSMDTYLSIAEFAPQIKKFIHDKNMTLVTAQLISELNPLERNLVIPLLEPFGQNKQRELLEGLLELSRKRRIPVEKLISSQKIQGVLSSEKLSPLQKSDQIRELLHRNMAPAVHAWKDTLDSTLKKLRWPREIVVSPSPYFEDNDLEIKFSAKSASDFQKKLSKLEDLAAKDDFPGIFPPYDDD